MSALHERFEPLQKETLQDRVYRRLCQLILEGGIAPGQTITVASLAEAFGVSPMPIREALARLVTVGALNIVSGRTIGLPRLSRTKLDDLRNVRLEIETTAAGWAAKAADEPFLGNLREELKRLETAEKDADTSLYVAANYDFHFTIYRQAGSPLLLGILESLWLQISPYFHLLKETENFRISNQEHQRIFKALVARDPNAAASGVRADIEGAYRALSQII